MGSLIPTVRVVARPNPFRSTEVYEAYFPAGQTVLEIIGTFREDIHITVGGVPVPPKLWKWVRPKPGCEIVIVAQPKEIISGLIAGISAGIAVGSVSTVVAGIVGLVAYAAVSIGLSIGLSMAVNALIAPQQPKLQGPGAVGNRYFAITGVENQRRLFEVFPKLYGRFRINPPLAANIYTEMSGNQQYLHILLCLNFGPIAIDGHKVGSGYSKITQATSGVNDDTIRIGETSIKDFTNVEWEIGTINQITLFTNDVEEQQFSVDFKPQDTSQEGTWVTDGASAVRTTSDNATDISVDIVFPSLICYNKTGKIREAIVEFRIDAKLNTDSTYTTILTQQISGSTKEPIRRTFAWTATAGKYDVRVTRTRSNYTDRETIIADASWIALRSIRKTRPFLDTDSVMMAIRIKSSGQLNGTIDGINILATSVLNEYSNVGAVTSTGANRNPAWAYVEALTGPQCEFPVAPDGIDWPTIQTWATWCDNNNIHYDWYHVESETLIDRIRAIAAGGLASWSLIDTKFSVVTDLNTTVVQLITPRNARNMTMERGYANLPHGLKVSYIDPNAWEAAERIVYGSGYNASNATRFEKLETQGCTSPVEAWKHGRYFLSALYLRPEVYTVEMDIENLVATRGDVVELAYDTIQVALAYGRIKSKTGAPSTHIQVDEQCYMEAGKTYAVRIRRSVDNTQVVRTLVTVAGYQTNLEFTSTVGSITPGDLFSFGESGSESLSAKITDIQYNPDFSATVKLVPAALTVFDAWTEPYDEFDPQLGTRLEDARPLSPRIISVNAASNTLHMNDNGVFSYNVTVQFNIKSGSIPVDLVEIWYEYKDLPHTRRVSPDVGYVVLANIPTNTEVTVKARARSVYGKWSVYSPTYSTNTARAPNAPGTPDNFAIEVLGAQTRLTWVAVQFPDLAYYQIRFTSTIGASANWDLAKVLVDRVPIGTTTVTVPSLVGTYLIKAFTSGGLASVDAAAIATTIAGVEGLNAVATVTESPSFSGTKTNTVVVGNTLRLDDATYMDTWTTLDSVTTLASNYVNEGYYTFATTTDLSQVYTSRITANVIDYGLTGSDTMSTWDTLLGVDRLDGSDPSTWSTELQIRTTTDNPSGTPTWSDWRPFVVGDFTARGIQFRIYLQALLDHVTPVVSTLEVQIDMPDRLAYGANVSISAGGTAITFSPAFKATPAVGIAIQDMSLGDWYKLTSVSRTGFTIQVLDDGNTGKASNIDFIARGYGYDYS